MYTGTKTKPRANGWFTKTKPQAQARAYSFAVLEYPPGVSWRSDKGTIKSVHPTRETAIAAAERLRKFHGRLGFAGSIATARMPKHEADAWKRAWGSKRKPKAKAKPRRGWFGLGATNPAAPAAVMFEAFTGEPSEHETIVEETVHDHGHLADIAQLVGFSLRGVKGRLQFPDRETRLALNETGTQLYVRGGDQSINLTEFNRITTRPVDPRKESVVLGDVVAVYYRAAKPFLGGEHTKSGLYGHKFKPTALPVLVYDTRSKLLALAGGVYYVKPRDYDGKHSRGIVD